MGSWEAAHQWPLGSSHNCPLQDLQQGQKRQQVLQGNKVASPMSPPLGPWEWHFPPSPANGEAAVCVPPLGPACPQGTTVQHSSGYQDCRCLKGISGLPAWLHQAALLGASESLKLGAHPYCGEGKVLFVQFCLFHQHMGLWSGNDRRKMILQKVYQCWPPSSQGKVFSQRSTELSPPGFYIRLSCFLLVEEERHWMPPSQH